MGLAHEVAAQGDEEEDAHGAAGDADEDGLPGVGVELEDVEGGQGEDRAGHHRAGVAADAGDDHVLQQRGAARVDPPQADGQDGDGDGRLHHLPDLEAGVGRGGGEDDAEEDAPGHRAPGRLGHAGAGRDDGPVDLAGGEGLVGVLGEGSRLGRFHPFSRRRGPPALVAAKCRAHPWPPQQGSPRASRGRGRRGAGSRCFPARHDLEVWPCPIRPC